MVAEELLQVLKQQLKPRHYGLLVQLLKLQGDGNTNVYHELGQLMECSSGTVKSSLFRMRIQARRVLEEVGHAQT